MLVNSYAVGSPRPRTKLSAHLLVILHNYPDNLLGLELVIARKHYRLTSYRIVDITGEAIATFHRLDDWRKVIRRSIHLL